MPDFSNRSSRRLGGFDYSRPGAYFVTLGVQDRLPLFGEITDELRLNDAGRLIESCWKALPPRFPNTSLDEFVIMPDHLHGIIVLSENNGPYIAPRVRLFDIVGAFKSISTVEYARGVHEFGWRSFDGRLWEREYYDRVVRHERALREIRQYIRNNVAAEKLGRPQGPPRLSD